MFPIHLSWVMKKKVISKNVSFLLTVLEEVCGRKHRGVELLKVCVTEEVVQESG